MTPHLESLWTRVSGIPIFARIGAGPSSKGGTPIVLVHGQVISSLYMVPTALRLALDYPVLAPDLPAVPRSRPSPGRCAPLVSDLTLGNPIEQRLPGVTVPA